MSNSINFEEIEKAAIAPSAFAIEIQNMYTVLSSVKSNIHAYRYVTNLSFSFPENLLDPNGVLLYGLGNQLQTRIGFLFPSNHPEYIGVLFIVKEWEDDGVTPRSFNTVVLYTNGLLAGRVDTYSTEELQTLTVSNIINMLTIPHYIDLKPVLKETSVPFLYSIHLGQKWVNVDVPQEALVQYRKVPQPNTAVHQTLPDRLSLIGVKKFNIDIDAADDGDIEAPCHECNQLRKRINLIKILNEGTDKRYQNLTDTIKSLNEQVAMFERREMTDIERGKLRDISEEGASIDESLAANRIRINDIKVKIQKHRTKIKKLNKKIQRLIESI